MRVFHLFLLAACCAPLHAQSTGDGQAVLSPADTTAEQDELDLMVQLTAQSYREQWECMQAIHDAVSAANEAERLRHAMLTRYKLYGMEVDYTEFRHQCDKQAKQLILNCRHEQERLGEAGFYGVKPLQNLFVNDDETLRASVGETLIAAHPLPESDMADLQEYVKPRMEDYAKEYSCLSGGPGFSRETALKWDVEEGVMIHERHFVERCMGNMVRYCGQSQHMVGDRVYDCLHLVMIHSEPYRVDLWFDITPYYRAAEARSEAEELVAEDAEEELPPPAEAASAADDEEELIAEEVEEDEEEELVAEEVD